jgi:hypothetical protein
MVREMKQLALKWLTIPEYNLIDETIVKCKVVAWPNNPSPIKVGVYFYPEPEEHTT